MKTQTGAVRGPINRWSLALWVAQALLALLYLAAGGAKLTQPIDALAASMSFVTHVPEAVTRLIGTLEVLGAVGLILPAATRIKPWLTPLAAVGLSLVQVGAVITHALLGETAKMLPINLTLLFLSLFIAWARLRKARIPAR
ncbi:MULTISPECIES: DoxX family protein [unclassified Mesorhizobium]|uniref:DoxX family protein n=1 Tax=unclassified Mesorhizobium TaxID=325217 RepID=UPI00333611F6